ncbi:unnamed protein product [Rotaria sp. Silwood1]|nr:unnamed protein product [Rotaria sp. Silwood1]CAF1601691.1 unnamed protein product [Rotaria sp. Silwood1]CAF4737124.1 unnamed protein product [Rotaria sp. Silwood1]
MTPSPIVLSAYGTNNKLTAIDVLQRWLMIYKEFHSRNIRVVGFSTDEDPKYLRAMRLTSNFFVEHQTLNICSETSALTVKIPSNWSSWFLLNSTQLFIFMQDGIHLCTKIRNRLLSKIAKLKMGLYDVSINHLFKLIDTTNNMDHNLCKSDLDIRDKQNFSSCQRIADDKVLNLLMLNDEYKATYIYLLMLNLLIITYTECTILLSDRVYYAWIILFFIRFWGIWLHITKSSRKLSATNNPRKREEESYFITSNALIAIELNAHYLIYVYLLIEQKILPESVAKATHLFSSQSCEHVFRNTRSLSGVYSTRINFTMKQFLKRINKLNVLTEMKQYETTNNNEKIFFPIHHKIKQFNLQKVSKVDGNIGFNTNILEEIVLEVYKVAQEMPFFVGMNNDLIEKDLFEIEQSSLLTQRLLQRNSLIEQEILVVDDTSSDEESDAEASDDQELDDIIFDDDLLEEDATPTATSENVQSTSCTGLRLKKTISNANAHKYFPVNINEKKRFLHKSAAAWYLQDRQRRISCDRLQRVKIKEAF